MATKKTVKKETKTIKINYINNHGSGFAGEITINSGTKVLSFFKEKMKGLDPNSYLIRVNREITLPSYTLEANDCITITPTKIEGA